MTQTRKTVERAIDLLNCFTAEKQQWSVSQLSEYTGFEKSIVSRLLTTLVKKKFLYKDPISGLYYLGGRILELANLMHAENLVCRMGEGILYDLSRKTKETVLVGCRIGYSCQFVRVIESQQRLRVGPKLGEITPLHAGAIGKSILAYLHPAEIALYIETNLFPITERTVVSREVLLEELKSVQKKGYAVSFGEIESDVAAIAAPIFDGHGRVESSICLDMPLSRFENEEKYSHAVCQAADAISALIRSV